jgi:hypothetical protein
MPIAVRARAAAVLGLFALILFAGNAFAQALDPLPSWNEGPAKARILAFVQAVTDASGKDFVPQPERIATFDNDGTLWCEQPMYVQMAFVLDRVKALAPRHPEWKTQQPFKAVLERDFKALHAQGEKGVVQILAATSTGMSADEFNRIAGRLDRERPTSSSRPRWRRPGSWRRSRSSRRASGPRASASTRPWRR